MCCFVLREIRKLEIGVSLGCDLALDAELKMKATRCNNNEAMSGKRKKAPNRPPPWYLSPLILNRS